MAAYTDADQYAAYEAIRGWSVERHPAEVVAAVLDAVAPAIAARAKAEALREAAEAWGQSPATSWLQGRATRYDRADEIERT